MADPRVCVALTAYNEEDAIFDAVREFIVQKSVTRVIVVDNNSTDRTAERARAAGAEVVTEVRQGYGYACIRALRAGLASDSGIIVLCEGDQTFSGADVNILTPYLDKVDMVLGNRMAHALVEKDSQQDHFMAIGNHLLAKLIQIRYLDSKFWGRARLTDVGCTLRAIKRDALELIVDELCVGEDHFSPHMIMVALSNGLSVVEVPVSFRRRVGQSKGASRNKRKAVGVGMRMLWHILTYSKRRRAV